MQKFDGESHGRRSLVKSRRKLGYNIVWERRFVEMAQDRVQKLALVLKVSNLHGSAARRIVSTI
jgi:hypothetical protein